ncbi:aldehyde dehydrogenase family-domain-containing protein [Suillus plorans]|uniref:Aldehyde dehydrogenase family-domain-containing protein n=1 Tax=Suillus plorans TaxID=116603 RepID=A0A9P7J5I9_9AGAM|nr:aldehyde dehydrogenase family-domain-containing protein [Suillus plorans]KAG1803888.1 aldehyde dehydrogenase family-domain-containing protein [Suillus plorans]
MAEIEGNTVYRSPNNRSHAMAMSRETSPRSSDNFNHATGMLLALKNPVKVEGHTWCSIKLIRFKVWVRGVKPINLNTTDSNLVASGTLYPVEDMDAVHVMIQKGVRVVREQLIDLSQIINPNIDDNAMRAPPFILHNSEIVTTVAGAMSETAHRRYMAWYTQQRVIELAKHDPHAAQDYSQELPAFHMTLQPRLKRSAQVKFIANSDQLETPGLDVGHRCLRLNLSASWESGYITSGKNDDATLHLGGKQIRREGYFIKPTIFMECQPDMTIVREEIFGSVMCIMKFNTEDEVVEQATYDTSYRLAVSVFTKDIDRAIRVAHALEAGAAWINCANQTEISMPFGGFKQSEISRELSEYALEK